MRGVKPPPLNRSAFVTFYTPPQQSLKELGSEVAASLIRSSDGLVYASVSAAGAQQKQMYV